MAKKESKAGQMEGTAVETAAEPARVPPAPEPLTLGSLVHKNRIVDLKGTDKNLALEQMVATAARALNLDASRQVDLTAAVQARDAALSTQLGRGWAAPHAMIEGAPELVMVVGRSKAGIDYGRPELGRVHLVFLFVSSPKTHDQYLRVLGQLANALKDSEQNGRLELALNADTPTKLRKALGDKMRQTRVVVSRRLPQVTRALIRNLLRFADDIDAEAIILFSDVFRNPSLLASFISRKIVLATRSADIPDVLVEKARGVVHLARGDFSEESAVQLALLSAGAKGMLGEGSRVVAVCGEKGSDTFDTVRIETPRLMLTRIFSKAAKESVQPEVFERALQLMLELSEEGREGKPIGTTMVLGDEEVVREMTQQLTINPFRGYDESERNVLDPALEETIKEFSLLDGAFVVGGGGVLHSAGAYLSPPAEARVDLSSGLGTRHRVAAAITKMTKALAIVLSQSTGRVTVFRGGKSVMTISPTRSRVEIPSTGDES
ncbi:MAG: DNA integrity scanning protein DisA nucleotide-binding domain protein [Planctomycetes bacterium]|nr:DNA integrity scanning protein DisA nucleotide-binding domain protein [Planctomycetota bacterium]MCB9934635.1 DNA integrity scanning protein DisA nucleotide-binding domain protein [Planctomycetota bacterium]